MSGSVQRIEFLETLGRGGFGSVYLANVTRPNRFVQRLAIKLLSADLKDDSDLVARQRDEARLLAQLNHDHIVKVMELTEIHGRPALIMEYVEGADCSSLLQDGALPPKAVVEVVRCTASALSAAWTTPCALTGRPLRVIHRDIKPANLLVSRQGGLKVLDFGIARAEFDRESHTTSVQYGTARYMAPEQWLFSHLGRSVDVFALGVSAIEMLGGKKIERLPLDLVSYQRARTERVEELGAIDPEPLAAEDLKRLLTEMLSFNPEDRPSPSQVQDRCRTLLVRLSGKNLAEVALDRIPALIVQRRQHYLRDPLLSAFVADPEEQVGLSEAFPQVQTEDDLEPNSEETLARSTAAVPIPSIWIASVISLLFVITLGLGLAFSKFQESSEKKDDDSDRSTQNQQEEKPVPAASVDPLLSAVPSKVPESPYSAPLPLEPAPEAPPEESPQKSPSSSQGETHSPAPLATTGQPTSDQFEIQRIETPLEPTPLILNSDPWGVEVWVDDQALGRTPILNLEIAPGTYTLHFRQGDHRVSHPIRVLEGRSNHFQWISKTDQLVTMEGKSP